MENFKDYKSIKINGGIQYKNFFPNGYGVSVIKHSFSYGNEQGNWELAVLKGSEENWDMCYTTPITDNVLGWLSEKEVNNICEDIKNL